MNTNVRIAKLFSLTLWFVLSVGIAKAQEVKGTARMEQIRITIRKVRSGQTTDARTDAAEHLASLVRNLTKEQITEPLVTEISSLLDSPDDSVRYWVARSLGNIGPAAKSAVPKLEKMLPTADCIDGEITSAGGIRDALIQMGVKPGAPPNCKRIAL